MKSYSQWIRHQFCRPWGQQLFHSLFSSASSSCSLKWLCAAWSVPRPGSSDRWVGSPPSLGSWRRSHCAQLLREPASRWALCSFGCTDGSSNDLVRKISLYYKLLIIRNKECDSSCYLFSRPTFLGCNEFENKNPNPPNKTAIGQPGRVNSFNNINCALGFNYFS